MRLPKAAPWSWLVFSCGFAVIAFIAAAAFAWYRAGTIDALAALIAGNADPSIRELDEARTELHALSSIVTAGLLDAGRGKPFPRAAFESSRRQLHRDVEQYLRLPFFFPTEPDRWRAVEANLAQAESSLSEVAAALEAGDVAGATRLRDNGVGDVVDRADVALGRQIAFNAEQGSRLAAEITGHRRSAQQASLALHMLAAVLTIAVVAGAVGASRRYVGALRLAGETEAAMTRKLEAVARAAITIADSVRTSDLRDVLQAVVDSARAVAQADFAALGLGSDPTEPFDPFIYSGLGGSLAERYAPPRPIGVLGAVIRQGETMRASDVTRDPNFVGLPEGHPPVGPFLGTVVRHEQQKVGHLYLGRRPGAAPFGEQDARAVELLAAVAAAAVQNVNLNKELRLEVSARRDVLAIVSHDLRNPLSAIGMTARALLRAPDEGATRRRAETIARNVARMDRLIGDLLAAATLQEGAQLAIEPATQDAGALVRDALEPFAATAAERRIQLQSEVDDALPPALCDAGRITQVLSNLIGNALKFTPAGGTVAVSVARGGADELRFSVRDTGEGIPQDVLPHVFERFWQRKEHRSRGTGLGLYIAKGIVDAHHGRIWVNSQPGEGSEFQFTVPAPPLPGSIELDARRV